MSILLTICTYFNNINALVSAVLYELTNEQCLCTIKTNLMKLYKIKM